MSDTLHYYNQNAQAFVKSTRDVDFYKTQIRFLDRLLPHSYILDFGCGSGRDTRYFLSQGYLVDAVDGSKEICKLASAYTGIQIQQMLFQELAAENLYDGIWACSSILHLPYQELKMVLIKMANALKADGIVYTSFKYGNFEGERNGRYFTDMTERTFWELVKDMTELEQEKQWVTSDVRPGREDERWLNIIHRKKWISQAVILEKKN